jgi:hypothetical protein
MGAALCNSVAGARHSQHVDILGARTSLSRTTGTVQYASISLQEFATALRFQCPMAEG